MSWYWLLPAATTVLALAVLTVALGRLARELRLLGSSLRAIGRVAVAVDDLGHDARRVDRSLRRLTHR
jgi:hypothetical protein